MEKEKEKKGLIVIEPNISIWKDLRTYCIINQTLCKHIENNAVIVNNQHDPHTFYFVA